MISRTMPRKQHGAALLIFFLILFTTAATVLLRAVNNIDFSTRTVVAEQQEIVLAKEALLAFAMSSADNYSGQSPGRLPCPDTNNNGLPNEPCNNNVRGRLPVSITPVVSGSPFLFSDYGQDLDRRFWYVVNPAYTLAPGGTLNSNTSGTLSLDSQTDIVAVIIAPGEALTGQSRPPGPAQLASNNYLEAGNVSGTSFVSTFPANPTAFNDRLMPIYRHEVMTLTTVKAARRVGELMQLYNTSTGAYPTDVTTFNAALAQDVSSWFSSNNWASVTTFISADPARVNFSFTGCSITYTVIYATLATTRDKFTCEY